MEAAGELLISYRNVSVLQEDRKVVLEHVDFHMHGGDFVYLMTAVFSIILHLFSGLQAGKTAIKSGTGSLKY